MAKVALQNLGFRYPGASAETLVDLSLTIEDGSAHALLGGSGTGKTTLLNLFSGLLAPTTGVVLFDGLDVSAVPGRDRQVAQVFQFPVLYEGLSVLDNLAFPLRTRGWKPAAARKRANEMAQRLGIEALTPKLASSLSLFEKQLLAIGKALVRPNLALVLLDEPLTAVEPRVKWQLRTLLRDVQKEEGTTMLYVTHDQTEALTFADRVSLMQEGRLVQTGTPKELHDLPDREYVGHFIGSPGMNLVPAQVRNHRLFCEGVDLGACAGAEGSNYRIGFRDSWADVLLREESQEESQEGSKDELQQTTPPAQPSVCLPAQVRSVRLLGTKLGQPQGNCRLQLGSSEIHLLTTTKVSPGQTVRVALPHYLLFCDGKRVAFDAS